MSPQPNGNNGLATSIVLPGRGEIGQNVVNDDDDDEDDNDDEEAEDMEAFMQRGMLDEVRTV